MKALGRLFVISAPSGAGKSTLLTRVMAELKNLTFSISHTTRSPRPGEKDGREYHFVDIPTFETMIDQGQFLEYARVHDNYYGTSRLSVQEQLERGIDVVLDIDVQGAAILRENDLLPASHIFVAPPDFQELERRLRGRGTESEADTVLRLKNARREMQEAHKYEYLVVNDQLDDAVEMLKAIILAERAKGMRTADGSAVGDLT